MKFKSIKSHFLNPELYIRFPKLWSKNTQMLRLLFSKEQIENFDKLKFQYIEPNIIANIFSITVGQNKQRTEFNFVAPDISITMKKNPNTKDMWTLQVNDVDYNLTYQQALQGTYIELYKLYPDEILSVLLAVFFDSEKDSTTSEDEFSHAVDDFYYKYIMDNKFLEQMQTPQAMSLTGIDEKIQSSLSQVTYKDN